ncbi:MAG: hypothetical protein E7578_03250 [Ruminococcaceae bacterium]|nr:hypothetical protein [Oscillospiraceae bacterium]
MKLIRSITSIILALSLLCAFGCGDDSAEKKGKKEIPAESANFVFTDDMVLYMVSYTEMMYADELNAAGVEYTKPLSEQMRTEDESWGDYIYEKTLENIEYMMLYCEAAYKDDYTVTEGMLYKANESVSYLSTVASDMGKTVEEYITELYGEDVTLEGLETCTQMLALCEGYEIYLEDSADITVEQAVEYAEANNNDFLKFDALRFTTTNKVFAEELAAAETKKDFLAVLDKVSGIDLTDADKNGITDIFEVNDAIVSSDVAGDAALEEGRAAEDVVIIEKDEKYVVTMFLSLPEKDTSPVYDYRTLYISTESSTDPYTDASSLRDQWIEKKGGEEGFANLAARYSDDPAAYYGGRTIATADDMPNESVAAWITSESRKEGDTSMLPGGDSGAYVIYYKRGNIPMWEYEAETVLRQKYAKDHVDGMKDEIWKNIKMDKERIRELVK